VPPGTTPVDRARATAPEPPQVTAVLVPVHDLVGNPGDTRDLHRAIAVEDVGDDPWGPAEGAVDGPLHLDLTLDAVVEGIWVHGQLTWRLALECGRCLRPVGLDREVEVGELFLDPRKRQPEDETDEGYELVDDAMAIDLERMLHDVVVLDLPMRVRCGRDDCVAPVGDGVAVIGEDEARAAAEGGPDPRWAALAELDLPESG